MHVGLDDPSTRTASGKLRKVDAMLQRQTARDRGCENAAGGSWRTRCLSISGSDNNTGSRRPRRRLRIHHVRQHFAISENVADQIFLLQPRTNGGDMMQKARCGRDDFLVCLIGLDFEHSLAFLDFSSGIL